MTYGLTTKEMKYLPLKTKKRKWGGVWVVFILLFLLAVSVLMDTFYLTDARIGAETAHAEEIHQNDYYCQQVKDGDMWLKESNEALVELCAKWGVQI